VAQQRDRQAGVADLCDIARTHDRTRHGDVVYQHTIGRAEIDDLDDVADVDACVTPRREGVTESYFDAAFTADRGRSPRDRIFLAGVWSLEDLDDRGRRGLGVTELVAGAADGDRAARAQRAFDDELARVERNAAIHTEGDVADVMIV
jgi:hypothetical protein